MSDTILIVDDEEPVRRTFREWLQQGDLGCDLLVAADAESALRIANQQPIDLAILDWNLGAGNNGLQLLEDLFVFQPHITAIMITGHAQQATPLHAMRMGIRDYLDKNRDLHRDSFLAAVRKQLDHLRPAKRERLLQARLVEFRGAVEKILPLVRTAAAVNDLVPLSDIVRQVLQFVQRLSGATDGVLVLRTYQSGEERLRVYDLAGTERVERLVPFPQSLASAILSMQGPCLFAVSDAAGKLGVTLQPFELKRRQVLGIAIPVGGPLTAVLELFDKANGADFSAEDRRLLEMVAGFTGESLRQALAASQTDRLLHDALRVAMQASEELSTTVSAAAPSAAASTPPAIRQEMQRSLERTGLESNEARESLELAEQIRRLSACYGTAAARRCAGILREVEGLLKSICGEEGQP
jgi:ActR/RegA family two-component response regulator